MNPTKKRKNFLLDRETLDELQMVLKPTNRNLTELINQYFKAVVKDSSILHRVDDIANLRRGSFIGLLDHEVGTESWGTMRGGYQNDNRDF